MAVRYHKEIEDIQTRLSQLTDLVTENVNRAMEAVVSADTAAAGIVTRDEQVINRKEVALEEACIRVMTLHQPVADELRLLVATMKINHDLERVGDLAAGIAKRVRILTPEDIGPFKQALESLVADLGGKLKQSVAAFFDRDHTQATRLWLGDDIMDAGAASLCENIQAAILKGSDRPRPLFTLLAIVQRIERLADHAANISKNVIYLAMGEIVRHRMGEFRSEISNGKPKVLMVCIHNSARSQMAAAWINHLFGDRVEAESAGLQPGVINPMAVRAMQEKGIDISGAKTRDVFELVRSGHSFSHVVTVCDEVSAEKCPPFPGVEHVQHWDLPDPAAQTGDEEIKMNRFRQIRDELHRRIEEWMAGLNV